MTKRDRMTEVKKRRSRNIASVRTSRASAKSLLNKSEHEVIVEEPPVIDYSINIEDRVIQSYYDFLLPMIVTKWKIFNKIKVIITQKMINNLRLLK